MFAKSATLRSLILLVPLFLGGGASAQIPFLDSDRPSLAPLLKQVTPAVVNISVVGTRPNVQNPLFNDPFFRRFFEMPEQPSRPVPQQSAGSGVIIDAENGYVLTNHHVIANADEIVVTLTDRRQVEAEVVGSDEGTDVALLRIEADGLTELELGDSESLQVGDFVVAIGNPFGLGQTVTSGIVSAVGRSGLGIEGYEDFIQTDASINPGNSGGALIDLDGRLVGINTAIVSPAGGNVGIGFAVPVAMARQVTAQLLEFGEVRRGRLGIGIQGVTPELAEALELDVDRGAVITQVEPGSAAEAAGLRAGDVIVEFNGEPVDSNVDLANKVGLVREGTAVDIGLIRDGRRQTVEATVGSAGESPTTIAGRATIDKLEGAEFRNIDRNDPSFGDIDGVLVATVDQGSPAWRNGLRQGDVITAVNRRNVANVDELSSAIEAAGSAIALNILRDDMRLFVVIQ